MKKVYKCLPAIFFSGFIAAMFILFLALPKQDFSEAERRTLEKAPAFSVKDYLSGKFEKNFETYLSDHTAGRTFWVGFNSYYQLAIGKRINRHNIDDPEKSGDAQNSVQNVYFGKDGYLINEPGKTNQLKRNAGFIEEFAGHMKDWLNVPTTVAVVPSTGYVCEDKLPDLHYDYHDDAVFDELQSTFKAVDFVDLRDPLTDAHNDGEQVFYRTDHHWTSRGAYTAYKAMGKSLGYTPNDESAYEITAYDGFCGSTYRTSGYWMTEPDEVEVWDNKDNDVTVSIEDGETIEQKDMYFYNHLDDSDKYEVFLDGNHPYTVIKNKNASSKEKLLVIKDSFAHSLVPFLADHYAEIVMVDMRYFSMPMQPIIEREGIDRALFLYSIDNLGTDTSIAYIE